MSKFFFENFDENTYNVLGVSRELLHRDLIVWLQKKGYSNKDEKYYLVIENKIKSLPTQEQLSNYTENLWENKLLGATLTGIVNTFCSDCIEVESKEKDICVVKWNFVSYATIAEKIYNTAKESSGIISEKLSQIEEYCDIIRSINHLLDENMSVNPRILNYSSSNLQELRLHDIFVKLKGAEFLRYVDDRKEKLDSLTPKSKGYRWQLMQSYNNGKATLDFKFTNWTEGCNDFLSIGIQVQEYSYRRVVERNGKRHGGAKGIFEEFAAKNWFDKNYNSDKRVIWQKDTPLRDLFCKYGDGFVYQYYKVENEVYERLFESIRRDLEFAAQIINGLDN